MDSVIKEIKNLWPQVKLVKGSSRHSESNGGVERVNQTVGKKLGAWMKDNNSKHWSIGCKIIQWQINTTVHMGIKAVPYVLTYGQQPRIGISNLPIDAKVIDGLVEEAQLNTVITISSKEPTTTTTIDQSVAASASSPGSASLSFSSSTTQLVEDDQSATATVDWLELVDDRELKEITKAELENAALKSLYPCLSIDHDIAFDEHVCIPSPKACYWHLKQ